MTRKVYIAMMSRDNPDIKTQFCMAQSFRELERERIKYRFKFIRAPSLIQRARNQFVADFMASDCTDLVMIDDDVAWENGAMLRLLSHDVDLVAGLYPKREDPLTFPLRRLAETHVDRSTGLMEVELVPTGFLRLTRAWGERMAAGYPDLAYRDNEVPGGVAHAFFWVDLGPDPDAPGGMQTMVGEDFSMCRKWRAIGGKVYADVLLSFEHRGGKSFSGCYADALPVSEMFRRAG